MSTKILFFTIAICLAISHECFAWFGFEEATNAQIDISSGNLVRVGQEIQIFDFTANNYHSVEVVYVESIFSGTRLEVIDFETKKRRIFYMER